MDRITDKLLYLLAKFCSSWTPSQVYF